MNRRSIIVILIFAFAFSGCEEVFEEDLTKEKIVLKSPTANLLTNITNISFSWDSLKHVDRYNLQVVSKSFKELSAVVLDTTVTKTLVRKVLVPGEYQWRVIAINSISVAYSDTLTFTIVVP